MVHSGYLFGSLMDIFNENFFQWNTSILALGFSRASEQNERKSCQKSVSKYSLGLGLGYGLGLGAVSVNAP